LLYDASIMGFVTCTCRCGHKAKVSEFTIGMTATCEHCRQPLEITVDNTEPYAAPAPEQAEPLEFERRPGPMDPDHCSRCGAPYRGDWDKYMTPSGRVCHICANQAKEGETGTLASQSIGDRGFGPSGPPAPIVDLFEPEPEAEPTPVTFMDRFEEFKESRQFRIGLWVGALGIIGLALLVTFTDFGAIPERGSGSTPVEETTNAEDIAENLTKGGQVSVWLTVKAITLFFWLAPHFLALLVALKAGGQLPGNRWWITGVHVLIASVILGVLVAVTSGVMGAFFGIFGIAIAYAMAMTMLYFFYDLRFQGLMTYVGVSMVAHLAAGFGTYLAFGTLGLLLSRLAG
jgi:hypothetical protein